MNDERYNIEIERTVNRVMDLTADLVPPQATPAQAVQLRLHVLDGVIARLQAQRDALAKRTS